MFIFILGLESVCDEFRIWVSNLVRFYLFIESLSRLVLVIYFVFVSHLIVYLSLNVMFVFVSYHVVFFVFIYVNCFYLFNYVS